MASNGIDPVLGYPLFPDTDAPDIGVDSEEVARFAARGTTYRIETDAARTALSGPLARAGVTVVNPDNGFVYRSLGGGNWALEHADIFGRMNRANTGPSFTTTAWYNAAVNANWTTDTVRGLAAFANGWVVPIAGRYRIEYELRATNVFAAAVTVNNATPSTAQVKLAASASVIQGVIAMVTVSGTLLLAASDVVRLHAFASAGSPTLDPERGFFSIEWVGAI